MGKKTVCYVGSPELFSRGASSIHMMKMCQAICRLGINVELVFPDYSKNEDIFEYYGVNERFKITTIPFTNLINRQILHGSASAVYCWIKKKGFDLVLTRNIVFTYLATGYFNIPTVYDAHHPLVNSIARSMFNSFKDSDNLLRFTANSRGLAEIYIGEGLSEKKLVVAHNGVDLEKFEIPETASQLREELRLPQDRKIVCYCGNTYSGRGIELLIDAASRFENVVFLIVGGLEEDNRRYNSLAGERKLENFIIRGFVPHIHVPRYLKASDVLVIPYSKEMTIRGGTKAGGFTSPIKLFEYMAAGKPIVSSSLPTMFEVLEDNKTASFFEPGNLSSFCEKLDLVLTNPSFSRTLSENASSKVLGCTWEARAEKILESLW